MKLKQFEAKVIALFFCFSCQVRQPAQANPSEAVLDGIATAATASAYAYSWGGDALFNLETPTSSISNCVARVRLSITDQDDEVVHMPYNGCVLALPKCVWLVTITGPQPDNLATFITVLIPDGSDLGKANVKFYVAGKRVRDVSVWKPPPNSTQILLMAGKSKKKKIPF